MFNIGDILVGSWGCQQTNVEFFQVVSAIGKSMIEIRPLKALEFEGKNLTGLTVPMPNIFNGEVIRKKTNATGIIRVNRDLCVKLWDGEPRRYSTGY